MLKNKVTRGAWGKNAAPVRCFWPQAGPQVIVLGIHFGYYYSFEKGSIRRA
jgi:hypothetical protein